MCTHSKFVYNRFINKSILVPCGKCPECLQSKANRRALKIRNHNQDSHNLCVFVTLTYSNDFVPYVNISDVTDLSPFYENCKEIPVYRDSRFLRGFQESILERKTHEVCRFSSLDFRPYCMNIPPLKRKKHACGIILWSDVQNFIKRLRINLKRKLNYNENISYFAVGEYGSHTFRPHFHLLIFFPKGSLTTLRPVIASCWPFGDMHRQGKRIQEAIDASSYVASYVTKSADLPKILESLAVRQKHSHSLHFGGNIQQFSITSLLEKADRKDMSYSRTALKDGKPVLVTLPVPEYIINRYFPKFKGISSFAFDEVLQLLRFHRTYWNRLGLMYRPVEIITPTKRIEIGHRYTNLLAHELCITEDEFVKFSKHLMKCYFYYHEQTGKNLYDYAIDYYNVWTQRKMWVLKHQYDGVTDFASFYENAIDFLNDERIAPTLRRDIHYEINPNNRVVVRVSGEQLKKQFIRKTNIKDFNSFALSQIDEEF